MEQAPGSNTFPFGQENRSLGAFGRMLFSTVFGIGLSTAAFTHNWDCISCRSNSMLSANFGTFNHQNFNMSDTWWIDTIADSHNQVILNNFWYQSPNPLAYNGSGTDSKITVARALKKRNPKLKVLFYQPADRLGDTPFVLNELEAHPEWWLRDDFGNEIKFGGNRHQIDPAVPGAQDYFANLSVSLFHSRQEAVELLDGVMVDGTSWTGASRYGPNISPARYEKMFEGKMNMLKKMQTVLTKLNGGEVLGNPLLEYGQINPTPNGPTPTRGAGWNTTLQYYDGAFDEMFGSFGTMDPNGDWDVEKMRFSFESIENASAAGKTVVVHAFPGPAGTTAGGEGMFPIRGNTATGNIFHAAAWAGPIPLPESADAVRAVTATRLVESLAPFLIVASERVFFSYGWFYNMEDGYIPCKAGVECGMPASWFPEYGRPLGPPNGPATSDSSKTVFVRDFKYASIHVDLRNRSASRIDWYDPEDKAALETRQPAVPVLTALESPASSVGAPSEVASEEMMDGTITSYAAMAMIKAGGV